MDLISEFESGVYSQNDLASKFGVGRSTVADIVKRKDFYKEQYSKTSNLKTQAFHASSKYGELNKILYEWFKQARGKNMPISGPVLQEKALQYATDLGLDDFKASTGWLGSWKAKYAIRFYKVCGESGDVNEEAVIGFKRKISETLKDVPQNNIFATRQVCCFAQ